MKQSTVADWSRPGRWAGRARIRILASLYARLYAPCARIHVGAAARAPLQTAGGDVQVGLR